MTENERQGLMNRFQRWLRSDFLAEEEEIKGTKFAQAEWEGHFNALSSMFANFVFLNPASDRVPLHDVEALLFAFGEYLRACLEQRWLEQNLDLSVEARRTELEYYSWPVSLFMCGQQVSAENN